MISIDSMVEVTLKQPDDFLKVKETLTIGQLSSAIDVIARASRDEGTRRAVIAGLSDVFNPEMFSLIGTVNDNYSDTLEDMRRAFGI